MWLFLIHCRKKNELPSETQDGKRTFGCTIDGAIFKTKGSLYIPAIKCDYQAIYPGERGFVFGISGINAQTNCDGSFVSILGDSIKIEQGNTYTLGQKKRGSFRGEYKPRGMCLSSNEPYRTTTMSSGEIRFTRFDEENQIAAGTFWFDLMDDSGKVIKIRNGRFDMPFIR